MHNFVVVSRFNGMAVRPSRAFDFHSTDLEDISVTLAFCTDLDDLPEMGFDEDTDQEAPFDVEPDMIVYAEQDARGIWRIRRRRAQAEDDRPNAARRQAEALDLFENSPRAAGKACVYQDSAFRSSIRYA